MRHQRPPATSSSRSTVLLICFALTLHLTEHKGGYPHVAVESIERPAAGPQLERLHTLMRNICDAHVTALSSASGEKASVLAAVGEYSVSRSATVQTGGSHGCRSLPAQRLTYARAFVMA